MKYQLSKDGGTTWYYYNGSAWTVAGSASYSLANPLTTINTNIVAFHALSGGRNFKVRIFLHSSGSQQTEVDTLTLNNDVDGPTINGFAPLDDALLPIGNFNIILDHTDSESGVKTSSSNVTLKKWNGTSYGGDISGTYVDFAHAVINATSGVFPVNNLPFGKYQVVYSLQDNF